MRAHSLSLARILASMLLFMVGRQERERARARERESERQRYRARGNRQRRGSWGKGGRVLISLAHTNSPTLCAYEQISEKGLSGEEGGAPLVSTILGKKRSESKREKGRVRQQHHLGANLRRQHNSTDYRWRRNMCDVSDSYM